MWSKLSRNKSDPVKNYFKKENLSPKTAIKRVNKL